MANCVTVALVLWASLAGYAQLPQHDAGRAGINQAHNLATMGREASLRQLAITVKAPSGSWWFFNLVAMLPVTLLINRPPVRSYRAFKQPMTGGGILHAACQPVRGP